MRRFVSTKLLRPLPLHVAGVVAYVAVRTKPRKLLHRPREAAGVEKEVDERARVSAVQPGPLDEFDSYFDHAL